MTIGQKIQIEVTVEQAQVIAKATELLARLSIGQVGQIAEMVASQEIPMYAPNGDSKRYAEANVCDSVRERVAGILADLGYSGIGHSLGVGNEHVPIAGHRAYEIAKVLQKVLAEHRNPNSTFRGVNYDGLVLRYTQDPAPVARVANLNENEAA